MRRLPLALILGPVLASSVAGLMGLVSAPATAAPVPDEIRVTLTRVTPSVLTENGTLLIAGHIANASFTSFSDVMVRLLMGSSPLARRGQIARVAAGNSSWDGEAVEGSLVSVAAALTPGGHATFRMEIPVSALPLSDPGVYSMAVETIASDGIGYDRRGIERLAMPWMPSTVAVSPVRVAWLWPLADAPTRDARGVLLGTSTPDDLSPGGRLRNLVEIGSRYRTDVSWVIDPALLETARAMSTGYLVDINGTVEPGTRAGQAASWLEQTAQATSSNGQSSAWVLPYANVDADALQRNGLDHDLVRAVTIAPGTAQDALGAPVQSTLEWAESGNLDDQTLDSLAGIGMRAVILRDSAMPSETAGITPTGSADLQTPHGTIRAILLDSGLRETLSLRQQTQTQVITARERFLSELAFVALELPSIPRTLIAGPSGPRWNPSGPLLRTLLRDLHTTPWIDPVTLGTVLAEPPSALPRSRVPYDNQRGELPGYYLQRIKDAESGLAQLSSILADPAPVTEADFQTLLRAESSAWRYHSAGGAALINSVEESITSIASGIHVVNRDDVILSGDTGSVPVTIANDLDQDVTIGLRLVGTPAARLDAEPISNITIEAGRRASVVVPVRVVGSDPVAVRVEMLDGNGGAFGTTETMELRTTAYSRAARWFTIGAAILLVIMVVFDIYRRIRSARRAKSATGTV